MARKSQEVVFEGWLTKSPPTKRIWRAKWRRRWFSLKHSGEIPDQFILMYYADRNCRKLKGCINLDDCEQVDLGLKLEDRKLKFDHVFDIKTPDRTYYLAADTESEMKSWVTYICRVCGLKGDEEDSCNTTTIDNGTTYCEEISDENLSPLVPNISNETPPVSPVSTSPYIPISECITGKSPIMTSQDLQALLEQNLMNSLKRPAAATAADCNETHANQTYGVSQRNYLNYVNDMQDPRFYDSPRSLAPPVITNKNDLGVELEKKKYCSSGSPPPPGPLQSPTTDTEGGFTDDDAATAGGDLDNVCVTQKFTKSTSATTANNTINNGSAVMGQDGALMSPPPPRPPKSSVHVAPPISNYMNLGSANRIEQECGDGGDDKVQIKSVCDNQKIITDDMYDFPRSHQVDTDTIRSMVQRRHCYNNAAPVKIEGQVFRYDISPKPSTSTNQVFRYDLEDSSLDDQQPASPLSQGSSTATAYSNLPSPLLLGNSTDGSQPTMMMMMPPPVVNRELKPKRKLSDSASLASNPEPSSPRCAVAAAGGVGPGAPSVDRKLKPTTPLQDNRKTKQPTNVSLSPSLSQTRKTLSIDEDSSTGTVRGRTKTCSGSDATAGGTLDGSGHQRKIRAAPSPTPPGVARSHESLLSSSNQYYNDTGDPLSEQIYHHLPGKMQYLDLDLECGSAGGGGGGGSSSGFSALTGGSTNAAVSSKNNTSSSAGAGGSASAAGGSYTVYKQVDFKKTQAFNIARNILEMERKEPVTFTKK